MHEAVKISIYNGIRPNCGDPAQNLPIALDMNTRADR